MTSLDLKLEPSRLQSEQRAKEEKKRKEKEESERLRALRQRYARTTPQNTSPIVINDTITKVVLQPLLSSRSAPSANRQLRSLNKLERRSLSQTKSAIQSSFTGFLREHQSLTKLPIPIKNTIAQLRSLLEKFTQNAPANKKSQQQKQVTLQKMLQQQRAAAEEKECKLSRRL